MWSSPTLTKMRPALFTSVNKLMLAQSLCRNRCYQDGGKETKWNTCTDLLHSTHSDLVQNSMITFRTSAVCNYKYPNTLGVLRTSDLNNSASTNLDQNKLISQSSHGKVHPYDRFQVTVYPQGWASGGVCSLKLEYLDPTHSSHTASHWL